MHKPSNKTSTLPPIDLEPLVAHLQKYYDGNVLQLTQWLDRAVYLLHFIPTESEFTPEQIQNVAGALFGLKESLMEVGMKAQNVEGDQF